jgi:hypothetical protein
VSSIVTSLVMRDTHDRMHGRRSPLRECAGGRLCPVWLALLKAG